MSEYEEQAIDFAKKNGITLLVNSSKFGKHFIGDKEGRRIFSLTLSRNGESYTFDFGQSIVNSCKTVQKPQSEVLDRIYVYAGLKSLSGYSGGVSFTLYKKDGFALSDEAFEKLEKEFILDYYKAKKDKEKTAVRKFKEGDISRNELHKVFDLGYMEDGAFTQCLRNAIRRELDKETDVYVEGEDIINPTMYDVLTCLTKYDPYSFEDFCGDYGYDEDSRKAEKIYRAVVKEYKAVQRLFGDILEELQEIE